jgi:hypothetical protein
MKIWAFGIRVRLCDVRRVHAIILVLALLAAPLAFLAQSRLDGAGCDRMCCMSHGHHAAQIERTSDRAESQEMGCHHGAAGHAMKCQMRANHSANLSGPVAPIPPTVLSAAGRVTAPAVTNEISLSFQEKASSGFSTPPFEPPRA